MSESKHTPGPWKVFRASNGNIIGIGQSPTGEGVADCGFGVWRGGSDEANANANLIAAAPELLEALKETIPFMVEIAKARHHKFELHMADDDSTIGKAMRAIAKAEGRP